MPEKQRIMKEFRDNIPAKCLGTYDKAMSGKSRAAGVKAMCHDCMNYNTSETKRCTHVACPLYPYLKRDEDAFENKE